MVNLQAPLTNQNFISYFFLTQYFILQNNKIKQVNLQSNFSKNKKNKTNITHNQLLININTSI